MKNKKVLITGATSGLGKLLARELATKEYSLIITGRDSNELKSLVEELNEYTQVVAYPADLLQAHHLYMLASIYCEDVSVVINCAADFGPVKNLLDVSAKEIMDAFKVNVMAPISLVQHALPYMLKSGYGRIINIGSTGGLTGYPLRTPYCLSKSALVAFTKTLNGEILSGEYGDKDVNVKAFCICPGPFEGKRLETQIRERAKYKKVSPKKIREKYESIQGGIIDPNKIVSMVIATIDPSVTWHDHHDVITF
ncbi:MAG: SDR family oxidoreductase [Candidatus Paceibacterota bacterium]